MRLRRKVCMLGSSGVGKTSLVHRFVSSNFDQRDDISEGISIHKRVLQHGTAELELMLWDLQGADGWSQYVASFISGATGLVFVVDSTRARSLDHVMDARDKAKGFLGRRTSLLIVNKIDLTEEWALKKEQLERASKYPWTIVQASAKTGHRVEEAFESLVSDMKTAGRTTQ